MNKAKLVDHIANAAGLSKKDAEGALGAVMSGIEKSLSSNDRVQLIGFGTFSVSHRKATTGRNPRTGEPIQISARNVVRFKAGKKLVQAVN